MWRNLENFFKKMDESELGVEIMNYSKVSLIKLNFSSPQAYYNPPLTPTIID
ncbi:hypothetical protein [uncultured Gammaproteobacteria bacterium]|nr:hypothetical protein [uncultured Gammaproteobacteria bacterium]